MDLAQTETTSLSWENKVVIQFTKNPVFHARTKQIEISLYWTAGTKKRHLSSVMQKWRCSSRSLHKNIEKEKFQKLRELLVIKKIKSMRGAGVKVGCPTFLYIEVG